MSKALASNGRILTFSGTILKAPIPTVFVDNLRRGGYTYDARIIAKSLADLPLRLSDGVTLVPYAYKSGSVAMMDNSSGEVVDTSFSRVGNGWAMQNGEIAQLSNNLPRWDEFYYKDEVGYLVEESDTNIQAYTNLPNPAGSLTNVSVLQNRSSYSLEDASIITDNNVLGLHRMRLIGASSTLLTVSFFVKIDNIDYGFFISDGTYSANVRVNTHSFTYSGGSSFLRSIEVRHAGDGWCYIEYQLTNPEATVQQVLNFYHIPTNSATYSGVGSEMKIQGYFSRSGKYLGVTPKSLIFTNGSTVTRPAEYLQIPITATTDIWMKTDQGEQLIEAVPSGSFNVHDYITNGKLISLLAPMRQFTPEERSVLNV